MLLRIYGSVACGVLVIVLSTLRPAAGQSPPCGAVLDSYKGIETYSNGGEAPDSCNGRGKYGLEFQCVEFVRRFYAAPDPQDPSFSTAARQWGRMDAKQFFAAAPALGLRDFANDGRETEPPTADDILVSPAIPGHDHGHVAIVRQVTPDPAQVVQKHYMLEVVEQNFCGSRSLTLTRNLLDNTYTIAKRFSCNGTVFPVQGWLRAASFSVLNAKDDSYTMSQAQR